jgi:uncharacterized membrane protein
MYSKVRVGGHPVHPMLVAYPIAFYTSTFVGYVVWAITDRPFWFRLALAANIAGVGMALIAAIPGFVDWATGIPRGTRAKAVGLRHMALNLVSLALFAITLGVYASKWNDPGRASAPLAIVLTGLGVLVTLAAGWFGWSLVQDHHVGVNELAAHGDPAPGRRPRVA